MPLKTLTGLSLGAGLMYFFDPISGRRRRALLGDQLNHACRSLESFVGEAARDLGNRSQGLSAELGHRLHAEPPPSDDVLVERVRARLGHLVSHPRAIEVAAMNGHVVLRGPVFATELDGLLEGIRAVHGVADVADELEVSHREPPAALQAARRHGGGALDSWLPGWSPATKLLVGAAGGALAARVVTRSPMTGLAVGALGLMLATRTAESGGRRSTGSRAFSASDDQDALRESGRPGGGRGRTDVVGHTGIYPGSGPYPPGDVEIRTPATFVHGQTDDQGRQVEGGSEITNLGGTLLGGETPSSSSPAPGESASPKA